MNRFLWLITALSVLVFIGCESQEQAKEKTGAQQPAKSEQQTEVAEKTEAAMETAQEVVEKAADQTEQAMQEAKEVVEETTTEEAEEIIEEAIEEAAAETEANIEENGTNSVKWNVEAAAKMRESDMTFAEIGEYFGLSASTVRGRIKKHNDAKNA